MYKTKMNKSLLVVGIVGLLCASSASAAPLLFEDFEPASGFTAGSSIYPINGWSNDNPGNDIITKAVNVIDFPSVRGTMSSANGSTLQTGIGRKNFTEQSSGAVTMSFFFNREADTGGATDTRAGLFLGTTTGDANGYIRLQYFNFGPFVRIRWKDATGTDVTPGNVDVSFAANADDWYELQVIYDIDNKTLQADARKEGDAWTNLGNWNGGGTAFHPSSIMSNFRTGSGGNWNRIAMDDISVVPEPATLAFLGLGIVAAALRRKPC